MKMFFSSLFFIAMIARVQADTISLRADPWCPYNCEPGADKPGYIIEASKIIFEKAGHKIDYQILNWSKALKDTREGTITAAIGVSGEGDEKVGLLLPKVSQGQSKTGFLVKKGSAWKFSGPDSVKEIKLLGLVADYDLPKMLIPFVKDNKDKIDYASGENPLEQNIKKLHAGRITTLIDNKSVIQSALGKLGISFDEFDFYELDKSDHAIYLGFSEKNPKSKEYISILEKGWKELRKSGELKKILSKYNLNDWE